MIVGEGPGKEEDARGLPFVGPAGQLLDRIFMSVGWDTNTDWYLGNVSKCRYIAPSGTYKQNLTPTEVHHKACRPYIEREIEWIQPHTIVILGKTATASLLPRLKNQPMYKIAGKIYTDLKWPTITFFVMYHPAALLHAQKYPEKYAELRQDTWQHIQALKELVEEQED
jgi:DNA polymerase